MLVKYFDSAQLYLSPKEKDKKWFVSYDIILQTYTEKEYVCMDIKSSHL